MRLSYKSDYLSISQFEPIEMQKFNILTGINGSGKTQFLEAIKFGNVEIENIENSEIVYYNYNSFKIFTENSDENQSYNSLNFQWTNNRNLIVHKIYKITKNLLNESINTRISTDNIIYRYILKPYYDFESWFGQEKDYEILVDLKKEESIEKILHTYHNRFSQTFLNFLNEYLLHAKGNIEDINIHYLKSKFNILEKDAEFDFKNNNELFYTFLKNNIGDKSIFSISTEDFESPNLFLEDLANEEKEYQFKIIQYKLDKLNLQKSYEKSINYEMDEFIKHNGLSPIEQINNVLNEYDCNGYFLTNNNFKPQFGIDKNNIKIDIMLNHNDKKYTTNFEQLSSGEKTLIALSLLIYKSKKNKIIPRVLLLDEIDSSLHPSMIQRLLNVIQELFIKQNQMRVILATHSPTTVALSPEDSIYIINKNGTEKIIKQDKQTALNILSEGFVTLNNEDSALSINYNISKTNLPVLLTEGITDKIIIETAWKKIYDKKQMPFYVQDCFDASFLRNLFNRGYDKQDGIFHTYSDKILIALFDFDNEGYNCWNNLNKFQTYIENDPHKCLTKQNDNKNGFAILLPVPKNGIIKSQVIKKNDETFKDKSALQIELLFYGITILDNFFSKEHVNGGGEIINFKGNKREFAKALDKLKASDFENIIPLFEKIDAIINSSK